MQLVAEVRRQPGQDEIPDVIAAEQSDERAPRRSLRADLPHARHLALDLTDQRLILRSPDVPRNQPEEAQAAGDEEKHAPAEAPHEEAACQDTDGRPEFAPRIDRRIRQSALLLLKVPGEDL